MNYSLVRFTDGIYHVAPNKEIKNGNGNEASVYWKGTYYLAKILEESSNYKLLITKRKKLETDELKDNTENGKETEMLVKNQRKTRKKISKPAIEQFQYLKTCSVPVKKYDLPCNNTPFLHCDKRIKKLKPEDKRNESTEQTPQPLKDFITQDSKTDEQHSMPTSDDAHVDKQTVEATVEIFDDPSTQVLLANTYKIDEQLWEDIQCNVLYNDFLDGENSVVTLDDSCIENQTVYVEPTLKVFGNPNAQVLSTGKDKRDKQICDELQCKIANNEDIQCNIPYNDFMDGENSVVTLDDSRIENQTVYVEPTLKVFGNPNAQVLSTGKDKRDKQICDELQCKIANNEDIQCNIPYNDFMDGENSVVTLDDSRIENQTVYVEPTLKVFGNPNAQVLSTGKDKRDKQICDELQCKITNNEVMDRQNSMLMPDDILVAKQTVDPTVELFYDPNAQVLSKSKYKTDEQIWEELQCDIPYNDVLEFAKFDNNTDSVFKTQKSKNNKINIISVKTIPPSNNDRKLYKGKPQFCLFCKKLVNRFGRHITSVHRQEQEVKIIISHEKKSEQRKKLIDKLRTKGNYIYNHSDLKSESYIVARRPVNKQCPTEYMDCPTCFVRISKVSLRRHVRKCNNTIISGRRTTQADSKRVTFHLHKIADPVLKEQVFPVFRNDLVTQVLRQDHLAVLYGNKLVAKYSSSHHHKMIRANLRYIGKYLIEMRQLSPNITDFKSCFSPCYYDISIKAIRKVAGYDEEKGEYRSPYSASAIGTILKFCCAILESEYIKTENTEKIPNVQNFLKLLQTELMTDVNKTVVENLTTLRRSKKVVLPTSSDMSKLVNHLRSKRDQMQQEAHKNFSFEIWHKLGSYTLVGILVYNGRRPGEIERLLVSDFKESSQSYNDNSELFTDTSNINYTRCVLRGKLGRNVSIVLSTEEVNCIKYILEYRALAGVHGDNPYVFGLPGKKPYKFLNAGVLLKKFKTEVNMQHPERLFATNIRKNLATKSTKLSLNPDEKDHVMQFMGHSEKVHKNIYRQPDMEKDIMIMPRVLDFATGNERDPTINNISTINNSSITSCLEKDVLEDRTNLSKFSRSNKQMEITNARSGTEYDTETDKSYDEIDENEEIQPKRKRRLIDMSLGYIPRTSWTTEERVAARELFKNNIITGKSPSYDTCKEIIKKSDALSFRSPSQVKAWINYQIKQKTSNEREKNRRSWSTPEKKICREVFGEDVEMGVYPSQTKIIEAIKKYPALENRTPQMIVSHLQHAIKKSMHI